MTTGRQADITRMFDAIAGVYDILNHLLSAGTDRQWRRRAIRSLELSGRETVIDICTGTGDLAFAALEATPGARRVVGIDLAARMLDRARRKAGRRRNGSGLALVRSDSSRLALQAASADAAMIAFGLRNVEHLDMTLAELARVLRPSGRLAILEFAEPGRGVLAAVYRWYFRQILPRVGWLISRHPSAYSYLPASVGRFPPPAALIERLESAGFMSVVPVPLTFGIVYLYAATRAPSTAML